MNRTRWTPRLLVYLLAEKARGWLTPRSSWEDEYSRDFRQEERVCTCQAYRQDIGQTLAELHDRLGPQYEQDMEEPPRLSDAELVEEIQRIASLYWQRKVPYILVAEFPGHTNRFLSFNVETPASTTLRRAVEDLMELK